MKTSAAYSFQDILHRLAKQDPEEKLRLAFSLNNLVKKVREAGIKYGKTTHRQRTRTTA